MIIQTGAAMSTTKISESIKSEIKDFMSRHADAADSDDDYIVQFSDEASKDVIHRWTEYKNGSDFQQSMQLLASDLFERRQIMFSETKDFGSFNSTPDLTQEYYIKLAEHVFNFLRS